jgi:RNA polymerase sigma factor (sigma-70 family)
MTDSHTLLSLYVRTGSESAFRELVSRYIDLVYSTAYRLVGGDAQSAQDAAQTVFLALAAKAGTLPKDVMLGGWLHQHTRFVAGELMRTERRRQFRERQVVEMNAIEDHSESNLAQVAPVLDEAIGQLDAEDRTAILLRFFERKDFRSVGEALGSSEDAARKRVNRALEKLHVLLKHRGATLSAAALGTGLATEAVTAAPAGLAATISSAAAAASTFTSTLTVTKAVAMTTIQKTIIATTIALSVAVAIYETRQASTQRGEVAALKRQQAPMAEQIVQLQHERDDATRQLAALRDDNERLGRNSAELLRLRGEMARVRSGMSQSPASKPTKVGLDTSDPNWEPNWIVLRPFDLAQFPDSTTSITCSRAVDVGTATPAALLQTWVWAHRTSDAEGILKTWDFPEGTTEEQKLERVKEAQRDEENVRQNPDRYSHSVECKLRDLFSLGHDYYLAFIEEKGLTTGTYVSYQIFRRVGDKWRLGALSRKVGR